MNTSEMPPAGPELLAYHLLNFVGDAGIDSEQMRTQQIEHARYGAEHRDPLALDRLDEPLCLEARFEVNHRAQQGRNPQPHELAEHVAERQRVKKMQRVKDTLILQVLFYFLLDRIETGQDVAVGVDDALRLGGRAGCEKDLKRRIEREPRLANTGLRRRRQRDGKILEAQFCLIAAQLPQQSHVPNHQTRLRVFDDAIGEVESAGWIQRNGDDAALHAAKEPTHPLRAILTPDDDALPDRDLSWHQFSRDAIREVRNLIPA